MTEQQVSGTIGAIEAEIMSGPQPDRLPAEPDPTAAAAVDLARAAAQEVAQPNTVGRHMSVSVDAGGLTMHSFDCTAKGYRGWRWAVTLAHVPGSDRVTVCDTVLLPGAESIMAPQWVPWSDRLAPGDLGAGDELPYNFDDPNLVPGYTVTDPDDPDEQFFWEFGLGRERVLGPEGVTSAATRWHRGPHGPTADIAVQASAMCVSCAYFVPLSGLMRRHFGACANEWSPADGSVVTTDFGCGAHSETDLEMPAPEPLGEHILDETVVDRMELTDEPSPEPPEPLTGDTAPMTDVVEPPADEPAGVTPESGPDGADPVGTVRVIAEPLDQDGATLDPKWNDSPEDVIVVRPLAGSVDDQAGHDADGQAGHHADGQAPDQADDQAPDQADDQALDQADDQADDQAGNRSEGEVGGQEPAVTGSRPAPVAELAEPVARGGSGVAGPDEPAGGSPEQAGPGGSGGSDEPQVPPQS